jgi:oxygen-independent coproporphyrinogen-3 oxidase
VHLYVHVPFCARRCGYCDFAIAVRRDVPSVEFAEAVLVEWARWRDAPEWHGFTSLATVYFGGGTPSRLDPPALHHLMDGITAGQPLAPGAEVTLEANPEDVSPGRVRGWVAAGVNRVSLGVQSFDPAVLAWMHRTHSAEEIPRAVRTLREGGMNNLSLDLIYALPAELNRDWAYDLNLALALEPDHLSLYGLTVEPQTPLGRWVDRGEVRPTSDGRYAEEFLLAHRRLTGAGFNHYEVSNYAWPGREAVHNAAYWRRAPYLGLGPSAHSAAGARRWWNIRDWAAWHRALRSGAPTVAGEEVLTPESVAVEDLYLGLRTGRGVPVGAVDAQTARTWTGAGWAEPGDGRLRLTAEGWLRLDALVAQAAG